MQKVNKLDLSVRIAAAVITLASVVFSIYSYSKSNELKDSNLIKENIITQQGTELLWAHRQIAEHERVIRGFQSTLDSLVAEKSNLQAKADSLLVASHYHNTLIEELENKLHENAFYLDIPFAEQLKLFLGWTARD